MSEFYIYNQAKERIGLLQHYDSVQWLEIFDSVGEVKIEACVTPENAALLADGNRIYNTDSDTAARISEVETKEAEGLRTFTVRADLTAKLLDDRVVIATEIGNEDGIYGLYERNRRGLPIEISAENNIVFGIDTKITWGSVLEAVERLTADAERGFKVVFDPETRTETFMICIPTDRTSETGGDYAGYFGTDVDNILELEITTGTSNYKNVAVVAGAGEGADRAVRFVGNVTGEARRELFVDAGNVKREVQIAIPRGTVDADGNPEFDFEPYVYTEEEYNGLLDAYGREKLADHLKDFSVVCDVTQNTIQFGRDYFLGDRMPVNLAEYGIYGSARIYSVLRVYDQAGERISLELDRFSLR